LRQPKIFSQKPHCGQHHQQQHDGWVNLKTNPLPSLIVISSFASAFLLQNLLIPSTFFSHKTSFANNASVLSTLRRESVWYQQRENKLQPAGRRVNILAGTGLLFCVAKAAAGRIFPTLFTRPTECLSINHCAQLASALIERLSFQMLAALSPMLPNALRAQIYLSLCACLSLCSLTLVVLTHAKNCASCSFNRAALVLLLKVCVPLLRVQSNSSIIFELII
jgi:hypothetical protein